MVLGVKISCSKEEIRSGCEEILGDGLVIRMSQVSM
jgi:hypothetical protein